MMYYSKPIPVPDDPFARHQDLAILVDAPNPTPPYHIVSVRIIQLDPDTGLVPATPQVPPEPGPDPVNALTLRVVAIVPDVPNNATKLTVQVRIFCHQLGPLISPTGHSLGDPSPWPSNTGVVAVVAKDDGPGLQA